MMRFAINVIYAMLSLIQKKSIEKIVAKFDSSVNHSVLEEGYIFKPSLIRGLEVQKPRFFDRAGVGTSRHVDTNMALMLRDSLVYFKSIIFDFLGPDCRLDDIYLFWFDPTAVKVTGMSGGFHDDNCGHRLKLFICIRGDGSTPTVFLPGTHSRSYKYTFSEFLRFCGTSDTKKRNGEVRMRYFNGDVALIDTNGLHRGEYEESLSERVILVVEFINKIKSNAISGRAPCGPGSSPKGEVVFTAEAFDILKDLRIIDLKLVKKYNDNFHYSLGHQ